MSVDAMSIVWKSKLDKAKKLILLAYADFADDDGGSIFPSIRRIAWKTGYTRRQVQRITRDLEKIGYMTSGTVNFEKKTVTYKINFNALPKLPPFESIKKSGQNKGTEGGVATTRGVIDDTNMSQITPDPSFNLLSNKGVEPEQEFEDTRSRQDYIDLQNAIITVCKRLNIMALQPKEIKDIDILYESGAKPAELRTFYGPDQGNGHGPSSWWYANDWRGKQGQFPTPATVIDTLEQARAFRPEQQTTTSNTATKAWSEVLLWLSRKMTVAEFSSPLTLEVIREITEVELKNMPEKQEGFYKKKFVGLFKDLEKNQN